VIFIGSDNFTTVISTLDPATNPDQSVVAGTYYVTGQAVITGGQGDDTLCIITARVGSVTGQSIGDVFVPTDGGSTVLVATAVVHASDHDQISLQCDDRNTANSEVAVPNASIAAVSVSDSHEGSY
jgi:hypothetical protein